MTDPLKDDWSTGDTLGAADFNDHAAAVNLLRIDLDAEVARLVNSAQIADGTVTVADLASAVQASLAKADTALQAVVAGSVGTAQLADGGVALVDLASGVQASLALANTALQSVVSANVVDGTIVLADLASAVQTSLGLANTALQAIPANSVGTTAIADGTVALADLVTAVQTSLGLADTALQSVPANSVGTAQIADGTVALADLTPAVQTSLGKADSALQSGSITAATDKPTPVGADQFAIADSAASGVLKKLTLTNLMAYIANLGATWNNKTLASPVITQTITTLATAATTTVLTSASTAVYVFTGTTTQIVTLPTTGIQAGRAFQFVNQSTGIVTINSSAGNFVWALMPGQMIELTVLITTPTTAAQWRVTKLFPAHALVTVGANRTGDPGCGTNYVYLVAAAITTFTLPTAAGNTSVYKVVNVSGSAFNVATTGGETVNFGAGPVSFPSGYAGTFTPLAGGWILA